MRVTGLGHLRLGRRWGWSFEVVLDTLAIFEELVQEVAQVAEAPRETRVSPQSRSTR